MNPLASPLCATEPHARVAESVEITIPRPRRRDEIIEHPHFYRIRNHLVHFLARRSKALAGRRERGATAPETIRFEDEEPRPAPARARLAAVND